MSIFSNIRNLFKKEDEEQDYLNDITTDVYDKLGDRGKQVYNEQMAQRNEPIQKTIQQSSIPQNIANTAGSIGTWSMGSGIQSTNSTNDLVNVASRTVPKNDIASYAGMGFGGMLNSQSERAKAATTVGTNIAKSIMGSLFSSVATMGNQSKYSQLSGKQFDTKVARDMGETTKGKDIFYPAAGGLLSAALKPTSETIGTMEEVTGVKTSATQKMQDILNRTDKNIENWIKDNTTQINLDDGLSLEEGGAGIMQGIGSFIPYVVLRAVSPAGSFLYSRLQGFKESSDIMDKSDMSETGQFFTNIIVGEVYGQIEEKLGNVKELKSMQKAGKLLNRGLIKLFSKVMEKQVGSVIKGALGEGLEELLQSDLMEVVQQVFVDKKIDLAKFLSKDKLFAGFMGVVTGGIIQGGMGSINTLYNKPRYAAKISADLRTRGIDKDTANYIGKRIADGVEPKLAEVFSAMKFEMDKVVDVSLEGAEILNQELKLEEQESQRTDLFAGEGATGFDQAEGKFSALSDKKTRFEIDDSKAELVSTKSDKLGEVLKHDELFKQYPDIKNINIKFSSKPLMKGNYDEKTNTIEINRTYSNKELKSTLLHEIQHAIQVKEYFARGGNLETVNNADNDTNKAVTKVEQVIRKAQELKASDNWTYNSSSLEDIIKSDDSIDKDTKEWALNIVKADEVETFLNETPFAKYLRLFGEIEARSVQARKDMTAKERASKQPYADQGIKQKDVIVKMGEGKQMSVEDFVKEYKGNNLEGAMDHRPSEMGAGYDIEENAPDFYSHPEYYTYSQDGTYQESIKSLLKIKGKPNADVTIYRASPKNELRYGDWITLSEKYAVQESQSENTPINKFTVKAKDIQFAGDDINEFGYFPTDETIKEMYNSNKQMSIPSEQQGLYKEALKYDSVEAFIESKEYKGSSDKIYEVENIEIYDFYENKYRTIEEIEEKISELEEQKYKPYDKELYESEDEAMEDIANDISGLEYNKQEFTKEKEELEDGSIEEWLSKNEAWLGGKYDDVAEALSENRRTGGTAWKATIKSSEEEAIEMINRMDISSKRHSDSGYDSISKRGMTDEQVSELRTEINKDIEIEGFEPMTEKQLTEIYNKAHAQQIDNALTKEALKYDSVEAFIESQTKKDYREVHQIDKEASDSVTKIKEITLDSFVEDFKRQYGYPSLKTKELNKLKDIISGNKDNVKIYRASPKNELNSGDWVTIDKDYANDIKRQNGGKVFTYDVKVSDLFYPKTLSGFRDLPSLNKWGAFQYQSSENITKLEQIYNKAHEGKMMSVEEDSYEKYQEQILKQVQREVNDSDERRFLVNQVISDLKQMKKYYPPKKRKEVFETGDWSSTLKEISKLPLNAKDKKALDSLKKLDEKVSELNGLGVEYDVEEIFSDAIERMSEGDIDIKRKPSKPKTELQVSKAQVNILKKRADKFKAKAKITRDEYKSQLKEIDRFIRKNFKPETNDSIMRSELYSLFKMMRDPIYTSKHLSETYQKVRDIQEMVLRRRYIKDIKKSLKKYESKAGEKGKTTVQYEMLRQGMRDIFYNGSTLRTQKENELELENVERRIQGTDNEGVDYRDFVLQALLSESTKGLKDMDSGELDGVLTRIQQTQKIARDSFIWKQLNRAIELKGKIDESVTNMSVDQEYIDKSNNRKLSDYMKNLYNTRDIADRGYAQIVALLDSIKGVRNFKDNLYQPIAEANKKYFVREDTKKNRDKKFLEETFKKKGRSLDRALMKMANKEVYLGEFDFDGTESGVYFTQDQLVDLYLHSKMDRNRSELVNKGIYIGGERKATRLLYATDELFAAVNDKISPEGKKIATYIIEQLRNKTFKSELDSAYKEKYNKPMNRIKGGYWQVISHYMGSKKAGGDIYHPDQKGYGLPTPSSLKSIVKNTNPLLIKGAWSKFNKMENNMGRFIDYDKALVNVRAIITSKEFKNEFTTIFNKEAYKQLTDSFDWTATGGLGTADEVAMGKAISYIQSLLSVSFIGGKTRNIFSQGSSTLAALAEITPTEFVKGMATRPSKMYDKMMESPLIRYRHTKANFTKGMFIQEAESMTKYGTSPSRLAMWFTKVGDMTAVISGGYAVYEAKYNRYIKTGLDSELADTKAMQDAENFVIETQQSSLPEFANAIKRGHPALRTLGVFEQSKSMYRAKGAEAMRTWLGKGEAKWNRENLIPMVKAIGIYHIGLPLTYELSRGNINPVSLVSKAVMSPIGGFMGYGKAIEYAVQLAIYTALLGMGGDEEDWGGLLSFAPSTLAGEALNIFKKTLKSVQDLLQDNADSKDYWNIIEAIGTLTYIPVKNLREEYLKAEDLAQGADMLRLLETEWGYKNRTGCTKKKTTSKKSSDYSKFNKFAKFAKFNKFNKFSKFNKFAKFNKFNK